MKKKTDKYRQKNDKNNNRSKTLEIENDPLLALFGDQPWDPQNKAQRLLDTLPDSGNILLTSHDNPDPDALASSMALQKLIQTKKGATARIAIGGILGRAENKAMSLELELDMYPIELLEDKKWDAIVIVDAQPGSGNAHLPQNVPVTAVIDHHPQRHPLKAPFVDIRPHYGAVSSVLVEYLRGQGIPWDSRLATALFYAIKSETADLGRRITNADQRAYFALFNSVDWELLHRIIKSKIPSDYFRLFPKGIERAKLYGDTLVANLGAIPVPDAVAELADFLLRHEAVSKALVLGRYEDQIVYSIRFTRRELDAGAIASAIVKGFGFGGGHDQMAGGRIILSAKNRADSKKITRKVIERFLSNTGYNPHKRGKPLLPKIP